MSPLRENALRIRTPEGIVFSLPLATPFVRLLAKSVDFLVLIGASVALGNLAALLSIISPDMAQAMMVLTYFIIGVGYPIAMEWLWRGRTLGKMLFGLRVVDARGLKLRFGQIVVRNLLRSVDMLPVAYFIGGTTAFLGRHSQRLGDIAAGTVVIRRVKDSGPDLALLAADRHNSLRRHPRLAALLRQRASPEAVAVAARVLARREELDSAARVELFRELAEYFKSLAEFPPEVVEGIPDEAYVRGVVDVLCRPPGSRLKTT